jgi:pyruvate, orthophosphate dikinase
MPHVYRFDEGSRDQKRLLGGKGANLAEMTSLGLPVPPGFIVTTEASRAYFDAGEFPDGLSDEVSGHLEELEKAMGRRLGDPDDPLLLSVRSGAPVSMPGMMDTVLNLGLHDEAVAGLARQSGDERFAWDAYRRLIEMFGDVVLGVDIERFREARAPLLDAHDVGDPAELDAGALTELVDRYKEVVREATGAAFPQDPRAQLEESIGAVFRSWNTPRARSYRRLEGIPDDLGTAVNVQSMVFGNLGDDSATGVAFTRNPSTGEPRPYGDWLPNAQGEDVVAGVRVTQNLDTLAEEMPDAGRELFDILDRLERHYRDLQDVEFTVERGVLWILQTRTGKRSAQAALRVACDLVEEGLIDEAEAVRRVSPTDLDRLLHPQFDPEADLDVLTTGLAASPGAASGQVVFTADEAEARASDGDAVILVRTETSPDDMHGLAAAQGVLTARGGLVSHAAIVARSIGKPAVCGAHEVEVDLSARCFRVGDVAVGEGDVISLDGTTGLVALGEVAVVEPQPDETFQRLLGWADRYRRLGVRANADTAEDATTARKLGAEGIGLCRTEHMFFDERLPIIQHVILADDPDDERAALDDLEAQQREDFATLLEAMDGLPVTVRLLDPPLHEFLPDIERLIAAEATGDLDDEGRKLLEASRHWQEENPMLGTRGVRLGIVKPELYRMQVRALLAAAAERVRAGGRPNVQVMIPLTVSGTEMALMAEWLGEAAREVVEHEAELVIGTMIETPRAAIAAAGLAEFSAFFSFGTNDLTQLTFGFSRDDVATRVVQPYLDQGLLDADPFQTIDREGVGYLVRRAVEEGRRVRPDIELGLCGEHGADPESVAFCHAVGLDYVSCSPFRVPVARLAAAHAALADDD